MLQFARAGITWWQKPLVLFEGKPLPAEIAVLRSVMGADEEGAWLNSRGTKTGVIDLREVASGKFVTVRRPLPDYVQACLHSFYEQPDITKGAYDLVIWRLSDRSVRFVEVKCPLWDRPTPEQKRFAEEAHRRGIDTQVVEWEFLT